MASKRTTKLGSALSSMLGAFYVTNCGYHCDDAATGESLGVGQVLRISIEGAEAESLQ